MRKTIPKAVSFEVPLGPIEGSKLHDADAEAVIKFAEEEKRAEEEQFAMGKNDVRPEAVAPLEITAETLQVEAEVDAPRLLRQSTQEEQLQVPPVQLTLA